MSHHPSLPQSVCEQAVTVCFRPREDATIFTSHSRCDRYRFPVFTSSLTLDSSPVQLSNDLPGQRSCAASALASSNYHAFSLDVPSYARLAQDLVPSSLCNSLKFFIIFCLEFNCILLLARCRFQLLTNACLLASPDVSLAGLTTGDSERKKKHCEHC